MATRERRRRSERWKKAWLLLLVRCVLHRPFAGSMCVDGCVYGYLEVILNFLFSFDSLFLFVFFPLVCLVFDVCCASRPQGLFRAASAALAAQAQCQLHVLRLDRHATRVDRAQVRVREQRDHVRLRRLLDRLHRRALEAQTLLLLLRKLAHQTLERRLLDQQLRRALELADLAQRDSARAPVNELRWMIVESIVSVRSGWCVLHHRGPQLSRRAGGDAAAQRFIPSLMCARDVLGECSLDWSRQRHRKGGGEVSGGESPRTDWTLGPDEKDHSESGQCARESGS